MAEEILLCIGIFVGKILEYIMYTMRTSLAARGEKFAVGVLGTLNNAAYLGVLVIVASSLTKKPHRAVIYALGCAFGAYLGSVIEKKLAFGKNIVTIIIDKKDKENVTNSLTREGFSYVAINGKGLKEEKIVLKISIERKIEQNLRNIIDESKVHAVIFESSSHSIIRKKVSD